MIMIFIGLFFGLIGGGLGILFLCTGLIMHDLLSVFVGGYIFYPISSLGSLAYFNWSKEDKT